MDDDHDHGDPRDEGPQADGGLLDGVRSLVGSKKVQKAVIGTTLGFIAAILLYIPAVVGYLYFYYNYLPDQVTTVPVHLQYGFGPNPFGIAPLTPPHHLRYRQPYDISVSLTLPRSPVNLERGNFMIALHLLSAPLKPEQQLPYITPTSDRDRDPNIDLAPSLDLAVQSTHLDLASYLTAHKILHTSTRPAIIPYTDPLASLAKRLLLLSYHVLFPRAAGTVRLAVPMAEQLTLKQKLQPGSVLLEVQAGQRIQVYEAYVTFTARLRGLRWFMYRWWGTAFVLFTVGFWAAEVLGTVGAVLVVKWLVSRTSEEKDWQDEGGSGSEDGDKEKRDGGKDRWSAQEWLARAEARAPSSPPSSLSTPTSPLTSKGKGKGFKKEEGEEAEKKRVKKEEDQGVEGLSALPEVGASQSTEADDEGEDDEEEEDDDDLDDEEAGTVKSRARAEDSGVGTSYSGQGSKEGARKRNVSERRSSR